MIQRVPFPENAPGDFYVEDGCCLSCGMPTTEAPELFAYSESGHCFVKKQPTTPREVYQMTQAFAVQDVGCIRYKGSNRVVMMRLVGIGEGEQCDNLPSDLASLTEEMKSDPWGLGGKP
jgi:hypothetical protein